MGDNTKLSIKKAVAAILCMAAFCLCFSQSPQSEDAVENQTSSGLSSLKSVESSYTFATGSTSSASDLRNSTENETNRTTDGSSTQSPSLWSSIGPFVNMILVLIVVIACIYGIVWLLKKSMRPGAENDPYLKKTASITLSPGKTVQIVTMQDKAYLLGVSDSSITLISEITDKELVDAMNLNATTTGGKKPADFASLLSSLTGSAKRTESFLKSRREKLSGREGKK